MGNEVPRNSVFPLKSKLVCFGSHPGEPNVLRMKTALESIQVKDKAQLLKSVFTSYCKINSAIAE